MAARWALILALFVAFLPISIAGFVFEVFAVYFQYGRNRHEKFASWMRGD